MISTGAITRRANEELMPAQTIERDYVLAHLCADIGAIADRRLAFKGGTLLRLCYFEPYRYSADLDFSATGGLSSTESITIVATAATACRDRLEMPVLEVSAGQRDTAWVTYVGPLASRPRTLKLDVSDAELVEAHARIALQARWPDLPEGAEIEGYTLDEVGAEKYRCIAERLQCRDLYDVHELLNAGRVNALEAWELYLRKAANDTARGRQRTAPSEWATVFDRRMDAYRERWDEELGDYLGDVPAFGDARAATSAG
jgi:uncharacterized protein